MGANDANIEIHYHPEQSKVVLLRWHHGAIDTKIELSPDRWRAVKACAQSGAEPVTLAALAVRDAGIVPPPGDVPLRALGLALRHVIG
jgi:hypothetical protein